MMSTGRPEHKVDKGLTDVDQQSGLSFSIEPAHMARVMCDFHFCSASRGNSLVCIIHCENHAGLLLVEELVPDTKCRRNGLTNYMCTSVMELLFSSFFSPWTQTRVNQSIAVRKRLALTPVARRVR